MAQLQRTIVNPDGAPKPIGAYSAAVRVQADEIVFLAGQVSVDNDGNPVGVGDMAAQTRRVFENLGNVLAGVGAGFSNVVEFVTYVVGPENVQPYIQARMDVYPGIFPNSDYPANTLLVISGLVRPEFMLEIKAVAAL